MKTRVIVAALALLVTFGLAFAAHAQGYPLLPDDTAPGVSASVSAAARP